LCKDTFFSAHTGLWLLSVRGFPSTAVCDHGTKYSGPRLYDERDDEVRNSAENHPFLLQAVAEPGPSCSNAPDMCWIAAVLGQSAVDIAVRVHTRLAQFILRKLQACTCQIVMTRKERSHSHTFGSQYTTRSVTLVTLCLGIQGTKDSYAVELIFDRSHMHEAYPMTRPLLVMDGTSMPSAMSRARRPAFLQPHL